MKPIEIPRRSIGPGHPCFVIAEAGVNHNGDVSLAKALVDAALDSGADAVKFQTWITEKLVAPGAAMAEYQKENLGHEESQFAMLKALELSQSAFREIDSYCKSRGILFLSTPDEEQSADFLASLEMPLFKVGSAELDNLPFLRHIARHGRPMILSTGMGTLDESLAAVSAVRAAGNDQIAVLHCVSNYPASPNDCNLRAMKTMEAALQCPIGFSDHTLGVQVALASVAMGACVIEKHLTIDKNMEGPDHRASLDPQEFRALVDGIRLVESALGNGEKLPAKSEWATRDCVRKRLVVSRDLSVGEVIAESDILFRRAPSGLLIGDLASVVGRTLKSPALQGTALEWSMIKQG